MGWVGVPDAAGLRFPRQAGVQKRNPVHRVIDGLGHGGDGGGGLDAFGRVAPRARDGLGQRGGFARVRGPTERADDLDANVFAWVAARGDGAPEHGPRGVVSGDAGGAGAEKGRVGRHEVELVLAGRQDAVEQDVDVVGLVQQRKVGLQGLGADPNVFAFGPHEVEQGLPTAGRTFGRPHDELAEQPHRRHAHGEGAIDARQRELGRFDAVDEVEINKVVDRLVGGGDGEELDALSRELKFARPTVEKGAGIEVTVLSCVPGASIRAWDRGGNQLLDRRTFSPSGPSRVEVGYSFIVIRLHLDEAADAGRIGANERDRGLAFVAVLGLEVGHEPSDDVATGASRQFWEGAGEALGPAHSTSQVRSAAAS